VNALDTRRGVIGRFAQRSQQVLLPHLLRNTTLAFLIASIPLAWLTYRFDWTVDDAFISFRYAKHLAQGHGLRYNIGEEPPVEGYSNPLWVLSLAFFEKLGWGSVVPARLLSVACAAVLMWRLSRFIGTRMAVPTGPLFLSVLFFATLPPVAVWSTSGLATMPYAMLVFLAYEYLLGDANAPRSIAGGATLALLVLLRVDGMFWVAGMLLLAGLTAVRRREGRQIRSILIAAGIAGSVLVGLTAFRMAYFGWALPNTAYAKLALSSLSLARGTRYLLGLLLVFPHLVPIVCLGAVFAWRIRKTHPVGLQAAAIALATFGYAVVVGGDWMPMGRYLIPGLPFITILYATAMRRARPVVLAACGMAAITLSLLPAYNVHIAPRALRDKLDRHKAATVAPRLREKMIARDAIKASVNSEYGFWLFARDHVRTLAELGRALKEHTRAGESIVTDMIGAIGYYSDLFMYDTTGLVNAEVGHRKVPPRGLLPGHDKLVLPTFFLKYRPTYMGCAILHLDPGHNLEPGQRHRFEWDRPFKLRKGRRIRLQYRPVGYVLPELDDIGRTKLLLLFMRRDLVYE